MLQLRPGGVLWGPPCKTWIWIARNGTGRTASRPAGKASVERVAQANLQVENFCVLAALAWLRGCDWVVENPSSTVIHKFKPLDRLMAWTGSSTTRTYMGAFGSEHCKPLQLWSSWNGIQTMKRKKPLGCKPLARRKGKSVTGLRGDLTRSAAYTKAFGQAFAKSLKLKKDGKSLEKLMPVQDKKKPKVMKSVKKTKSVKKPQDTPFNFKRSCSWRVSSASNAWQLTRRQSSSFF